MEFDTGKYPHLLFIAGYCTISFVTKPKEIKKFIILVRVLRTLFYPVFWRVIGDFNKGVKIFKINFYRREKKKKHRLHVSQLLTVSFLCGISFSFCSVEGVKHLGLKDMKGTHIHMHTHQRIIMIIKIVIIIRCIKIDR